MILRSSGPHLANHLSHADVLPGPGRYQSPCRQVCFRLFGVCPTIQRGGRGDVKSTFGESIALSANGRPTLPPPTIQIHRSNNSSRNNHTIINNRTTNTITLPEVFFLVFGLVVRNAQRLESSLPPSVPPLDRNAFRSNLWQRAWRASPSSSWGHGPS